MKRKVVVSFLAMTLSFTTAVSGTTVFAEDTGAVVSEAEEVEETEGTETEEVLAEDALSVENETEEVEAEGTEDAEDVTVQSLEDDGEAFEYFEESELLLASRASGKCGQSVNWSYQNGTLTITGSGAMYDYPVYDTPASSQCMPWYAYKDSIKTVNIAEGVTSIGACAFWGCKSLTSVTTPSTISTIGYAAFGECTGLKEVVINGGFVGESAFIRCSALEKVTFGRKATGCGISAFEDCTNLKGVYISDIAAWCGMKFGGYLANPLQFAKHLYLGGIELKDIIIPEGVTEIGDYVFEYGQSINTVVVPSSVKKIGNYAFYLCNNLNKVVLPSSGVESIGASAFDSCSQLKDINIPSSVSYIGSSAFTWVPISHAEINQGVIEGHAFEGCGCIAEVTIGSGVTFIGDNAFNSCSGLHTVHYGGSREQWNALSIGNNNGSLTGSNIECSGTGSANNQVVDTSVIHVGGTVKFGSYEQDNNSSNGAEQIEWTVLDLQGDKALIISKNVLDFQQYYPNLQTQITWSNSSIRNWLNNTFYNTAFTDSQKAAINTTNVSAENNSTYGTSGGSATDDKVFLLSASEAEKYFETDGARMANCTEYALSRNGDSALRNNVTQSSYWWLRTPGIFDYDAMYVHYTGSLSSDGMAAANVIGGVRPVMWVNANAVEVVSEDSQIGNFVNRLYSVCLNRTPDAAGKADWVNRLSNGTETGSSAAYGFIFSTEFQNYNYCNEDYVKQLYRAFMGREYDQGGLEDWVNKLETGTTREEVFNGFAQSAEFTNICAEYGITLGDGIAIPQYGTVPHGPCSVCGKTDGVTAFVTRLYNICLDREPDTDGLNDWTNSLWEHSRSGRTVSAGFIFSEEFTNKGLNDEDYVEYLYRAFFDRSSDEGGKSDWLNRMHNEGYSREDVFNGFVGSTEFDNLCKKYGITRE